jgi:hypothetical protein
MDGSMGQRVLIPLPGVGTLALEEEAYRQALEEGEKFNPWEILHDQTSSAEE